MAVQKSKKSRSKRGMRRANDGLTNPALSINEEGELHLRHHISPNGVYRKRQVIEFKQNDDSEEQE